MSYQHVIYEKRDRIAYVTLNRPEVLNTFNLGLHEELGEIWEDFDKDRDTWVGIITGAGDRAFSAGRDLKEVAETGTVTVRGGSRRPSLATRFDLSKPIIAAVNGYCLGGGLETALACDIIVASENARFGLREPRVGLIAGGGGIHRLPRQVPLKQAMGILLTAKMIDAQEACRIGLVNEVVPLPQLMATAERWAREIMECAPLAARATKEMAIRGLDFSLEMAMKYTYTSVIKLVQSEDFREGPKFFAQKRKPEWKAR
jgi:crotonobetainyl-CoA hydratase